MKDKAFTFRNMFGKEREVKYTDITKLKRVKGGYHIYTGKKKIVVDNYTPGVSILWDELKVLKIPNPPTVKRSKNKKQAMKEVAKKNSKNNTKDKK